MAGQTACRAIVACNLPRFCAYIRAMIGPSKRIRSSFATNQKRCSSTRWRFRAVRGNFIAPLAHPNSKKKTTNLLRQKKGIKGAVFKSFIFLSDGAEGNMFHYCTYRRWKRIRKWYLKFRLCISWLRRVKYHLQLYQWKRCNFSTGKLYTKNTNSSKHLKLSTVDKKEL